jgi:threonine synthase
MGLSVVPDFIETEMRSTKTWSAGDKEDYQAAIELLNESNQQETNPALRRQQWGVIRRLEKKYGVVSEEEYLEALRSLGGG